MKIKKLFFDLNLRSKLIMLFLIISIIPIIITSTLFLKISENEIIDTEVETTIRELSIVNRNINNYLNEKDLILLNITMNENVRTLLTKEIEEIENTYYKENLKTQMLIFQDRYNNGDNLIYLYGNNGLNYTNDIKQYFSPDDFDIENDNKFYSGYELGGIKEIHNNYYIPIIRFIKDIDTNKEIGKAILLIEEEELYKIYEEVNNHLEGSIYILNNQTTVMTNKNKSLLNRNISDILDFEIKIEENDGYSLYKKDLQDRIIIHFTDDIKGNWKYLCGMPLQNILESPNHIKKFVLWIVLGCIIICILFAFFTSSIFTKPIKKLISIMNKAEQGNLKVRFFYDYNDEIGILKNKFNKMISNLDKLFKDLVKIQSIKRKAEYEALVSQINPHFLYNTLNSIIWLAHNNDNNSVIKMTESLANFFRMSIKSNELTTIQNELAHLEEYINIQKIRYKNIFHCIFDVNITLLSYKTIKLILQPLVENSIYHGIKEKKEKGLIIVSCYQDKETIIFKIKDNGNLPIKKINQINKKLEINKIDENGGIGIRNINTRIKLYFGVEYGLTFEKENNFTVQKIVIPILKGDI